MLVYVDPLKRHLTGANGCHVYRWQSHLFVEGTEEYLHEFARQINLKEVFFRKGGMPYYLLSAATREDAIKNGAIEVSVEEMAKIWERCWADGSPAT